MNLINKDDLIRLTFNIFRLLTKFYQWWWIIWSKLVQYLNRGKVLSKENTDKDETSFFNLDIKIRKQKFQVGLFEWTRVISFLLLECLKSLVMKQCNVTMWNSDIWVKSLRNNRASNNSNSVLRAIKPIATRMRRKKVPFWI